MDIIKKTMSFELYRQNKEWIRDQYSNIKTSVYTPILTGCAVGAVIVAICLAIVDHTEISTREYDSIQSNIKHYATKVPEYAASAKKFMADGKIVEWEYGELRQLTRDYHEEQDRLELLESKRKLSKTVND